ncbi:hypothetical protein FACS1894186_3640 [Alphaproteobacteria bacterium]|nr:hypothetical protein FACS1894186_3640 [Alphaproteobacteria bacterium]
MFIFQKQLAQQKQLEEVNAAGAIRTLRDAVKSAVALQRDDLVGYPEGVTLKDASEFLPQEYFSGFRVAVRREGAKLSAIIVSPTSLGRYALDNLSAARISSMLGASGGFVPSLTDEPSSTANGTLGLWSLDINEISAEFADPVRIVVNIEFSEETGGLPAEEKEKILYRTADYGQASNTMLTALFFNDGTKDTIRIDPDGSFTNGAFTINPDGSITNGSFTVDSAGNLVAAGELAGGSLKVSSEGSFGSITLGNGKFTVGAGGEIVTLGAFSGTSGKFSGALEAASGEFAGRVKGGAGEFSGNVESAKLVWAKETVVEGDPCEGGQIGSDSEGSTMLCFENEWGYGGTKCDFTDQLFTTTPASTSYTDATKYTFTWVVPCTGFYEITAIGGGGGSDDECMGVNTTTCAGGGGSSALYLPGQTPLIIGGGGGGGCWYTGNGAEKSQITAHLIKDTIYTIKIGQGGQERIMSPASKGNGGHGYNQGGFYTAGYGADYKNSQYCTRSNANYRGGDVLCTNTLLTPGPMIHMLSGLAQSFGSAVCGHEGYAGAIYIKLMP